jgi:hypothetical protein
MAATATADEVYRVVSVALDAAFYRTAYPEAVAGGGDPLRDYLDAGWRQGRDPAPWFSVETYLKAHPDVRRTKVDPFYHYLVHGWREGREIGPSAQGERYLLNARSDSSADAEDGWAWSRQLAAERALVEDEFDAAFYLQAHRDVAEAGSDPLEHFLVAGWREGRDPNPRFSVRHYLEAYPDVAAADENPFVHYLRVGRAEGRKPLATARALIEGEFDAAFYLKTYPDVGEAGSDPLEHFLMTGWREGRDPNPRFSVRDYLETYPDIAAAGVNPFVHYVQAGRAEGRKPRNELGFRYQVLSGLRPVAERTAEIAVRAAGRRPTKAAALAEALSRSRSGLTDLHVTFSHDDYSANLGGVQLCVQREDARIAELGRDHLHLYPADPWPVVREATEPGLLGALWNGERVGFFKPRAIAAALKAAGGAGRSGQRTFAIHSLLGHSPDETADILAAVGLSSGWFWLHDFASLCSGYHLLRNDVQDCAAPPPGSPACSVCAYFTYRQRHIEAHRRLFQRLDLTVVAPSQSTLDLWVASGLHPTARTMVLPHATLLERGPAPVATGRPLRIAYAGLPAVHKGWDIFRALVLRHEGDGRYAFHHLGGRSDADLPLAFHPVVVTEERSRAMQEALEAAEIDLVLVWPLCRETFSFIAYEAVAAGCAVITGPDSGNVQAFVREGGHGWVLPDEAALAEAFELGRVSELGRAKRKPMLYDLAFSNLTVDLFAAPTAAAEVPESYARP